MPEGDPVLRISPYPAIIRSSVGEARRHYADILLQPVQSGALPALNIPRDPAHLYVPPNGGAGGAKDCLHPGSNHRQAVGLLDDRPSSDLHRVPQCMIVIESTEVVL